MMDHNREEKVAYYYSDLGRKEVTAQDHSRSAVTTIEKLVIDQQKSNQEMTMQTNADININTVVTVPPKTANGHEASYSSSSDKVVSVDTTTANVTTNITAANTNPTTITTTTTIPQQPQYLITNGNSQQLTNLTPMQQQQLAHQYNQSTFQNKLLSNYHINSNHQLYHTGSANNNHPIQQLHHHQQQNQQQQQHQQHRHQLQHQFQYPQVQSIEHQPFQQPAQNLNINGEQRSQDDINIYEDIDNATLAKLQANYYGDTMSLHSEKKNAKWIGSSFTRWFSTRKKTLTSSHSSDMEENPYNGSRLTRKPRRIIMPKINDEQLKSYPTDKLRRRCIVESIVESENSYLNSLHRLIEEYKKPLEEANPSILSKNKIDVIFFNLQKIFYIHSMFSLQLDVYIQDWDEKERIGDIFAKCFSRPEVLDTYSNFINNFTNAMETARRASKSKSFALFLHDKTISSPDRLTLFGSMVKPVQRFPQFILFLHELLKHTPRDHLDRISLQTALTELESLADKLNERKRDAERHFAVKQLLKDYLTDSNNHSQRILLRQDDICLLDMKSKSRRLYLLNDMLICVSIPSNRLKFAVSLCDIDIVEDIGPAACNLYSIERMECDRQSLVHDLDLMAKISSLVASLKYQYNGLSPALPDQIRAGIREEIRIKEFQIAMIDRSCLQLRIKAKNNKETICVQFYNPENKQDWLIDLRLTKLALDADNNPGWKNINQAPMNAFGHNRSPLFVKSLAVFGTSKQSQLTCALHYPAGVLWICNVNREASSLGALATNGAELSLIHSYELSDSHVTCLESVGSTLWIGLRQGRIIVIDANSPGKWVQFNSLLVHHEVTCIKYFGHFVYVGLISGAIAIYNAINFEEPLKVQLTEVPITCLIPVNKRIFACSHKKVYIIQGTDVVENFPLQNESDEIITTLEEEPRPNLLAHCGSGLWVSLIDSSIVKLYHAETLKHMRDINIGDSIRKILTDTTDDFKITVTSMLATRGLLWIGTNIGIVATLMLPRLQGVPVASGGIDIALHRFLGPVNLLLNLSLNTESITQQQTNALDLQVNQSRHANLMDKNEETQQIYGQYADLMNVDDYISARSGKPGSTDVSWDIPMNISSINNSDDSASSASSPLQQQNQAGIPIVPQDSSQMTQSQANYNTQPPTNKIYERPQIQQHLMRTRAQINSATKSLYGQTTYEMVSRNHTYSNCKTALVLAGGNGYQRLVYGDTFSQNAAHCIIWEHKL